jgi:hypothetical protein
MQIITEQQQQFALYVLSKSGKQDLLQRIIDRCNNDSITIWQHFEEGLVKQYNYTQTDAEAKVREWYYEFLAAQQGSTGAATGADANTATHPATPPATEAPVTEKSSLAVDDVATPPATRKRSLAWLWITLLLAGGGAAAYYFLVMKPGKDKAKNLQYVLAEDGVVLRENNECDTAKNRKIMNIAYNQPVEIAPEQPAVNNSGSRWVKVMVTGADGNVINGFVADDRMLGPKEVNQSLDSIYRDRAFNPQAERLSYPLKRALYEYIKNANFEWCVEPVTDNSAFQTIVDLSRKKYGKTTIGGCELTSFTKYRVAILTNRSTGYKKAMIFSLTNNYTSEKVDEKDLSDITDPIIYKASDGVFITEGRVKESKKVVVDKNSSGVPVFKTYVPPVVELPVIDDWLNGGDLQTADTTAAGGGIFDND